MPIMLEMVGMSRYVYFVKRNVAILKKGGLGDIIVDDQPAGQSIAAVASLSCSSQNLVHVRHLGEESA